MENRAMPDHVCGAFTGKKLAACCACCQTPTYDILETFAEGPRAGEARRIGWMLETGTQVELMLNDGSIATFELCTDCAPNLKPEHLLKLWDTNVTRVAELARLAGRQDAQQRALVRQVARVYPVGVVRWRRQDRELLGVVPDGLVIDRRRRR